MRAIILILVASLVACSLADSNVSTASYAPIKTATCRTLVNDSVNGTLFVKPCDYDAVVQDLPDGPPNKGIHMGTVGFSILFPPTATPRDRAASMMKIDLDARKLVSFRFYRTNKDGQSAADDIFDKIEVPLSDDNFTAIVAAANALWNPPPENPNCVRRTTDVAGSIFLFDGKEIAKYSAYPTGCVIGALVDDLKKAIDTVGKTTK